MHRTNGVVQSQTPKTVLATPSEQYRIASRGGWRSPLHHVALGLTLFPGGC